MIFKMKKMICLLVLIILPISCLKDDEEALNETEWNLSPTMTVTLDNGVLTITTSKESEAMPDYDFNLPPWYDVSDKIYSVVIENSVSSIGIGAFHGYSNLTSVTIPNSVISIGDWAFTMCLQLTSVMIPNSVTSIGDVAFSGCGITSVTIPNSVTFIGVEAFSSCLGLTAIHVDTDNPAYSSEAGVLYNKNKTRLIVYPPKKSNTTFIIPSTVITIETVAFLQSWYLTSITIPNSVKTIRRRSFSMLNLTSLTIPASVETIETRAFYVCSDLKEVSVGWTTPLSVPDDIFYDVVGVSSKVLYVPKGTKTRYEAANVWGDFGEIIEK